MLNFITSEIKNRLNVDIKFSDEMNSKKYLTFNIIKSKFFKNQVNDYIIPTSLFNDAKYIIQKNFIDLSEKQKTTKLNQLLFLPVVLFNNIYHTLEDDRDTALYESGYQLSKQLLTSVMSPHDLYLVKNLLIQNRIIENSKYDSDYYFSIFDKKALKYVLNKKYKNTECMVIQNKYAAKFELLVENGLACGERKSSIKVDYFPYIQKQKNLQYAYQKQMYFDKQQFQRLFLEKYPNAYEILNNKNIEDKKLFKELSIIWSYFNSLNSHVFRSSESHGRIYMPFQSIPKFLRSSIRIGNNQKLYQLFDIHCCFVNLSAKIIKQSNKDNTILVNECQKIIQLTNADIYQKIIDWTIKNIDSDFQSERNQIKKYIMRWLFSNKKQRSFFIKKYKEINMIDQFFKILFPYFYNEITNYSTISKNIIKNKEVVKKTISELSIKCFQFQSDLMLGKVIPSLQNQFKSIPFISLHDAIFIPERFKKFELILKKKIEQIMKRIESSNFEINI